ncbi:MAG: YggS family pyridoxal phosphate-dependent enzyme [Eggerthellaceae bacterium]|nr:YggS family pyridoxal phosphate-dependent enzyme [Eggerthellaceae bacterium]
MGTKERFEATAAKVARVCEAAGRKPSEVTLVAVSKTVGPDQVAEAIAGGATDFGENRPDQLVPKADEFTQATWHFIGNIQSRRIRDIVGRAALVHSLFEERHARKINDVARERGIVQDVLVEVNVSGEESKSGLAPDQVRAMLQTCADLPNVRVRGLMTMAPQGDLDVARRTFAGLRALRDELQPSFPDLTELSMGMSEDWPVAIEEGATIVRIGRAIFSETF